MALSGQEDSTAGTVTAPRGGRPAGRGFGRVQRLTAVFCWVAGLGFVLQCAVAGAGYGRWIAALGAAAALSCWHTWWRGTWPAAVLEAGAAASGVLSLPEPQPVVGFLFAVTMHRAAFASGDRFAAKLALLLAAYVGALAVPGHPASLWTADRATVSAALLPLLGLVVGSLALRTTTAALAHALTEPPHADRALPIPPVVLDDRARPRIPEAALDEAIARDHLPVYYQPVVDLATGQTAGVEALVRWNRPGHGLLGPGEFIAVAERSGLIVDLGALVLRKACAQAKAWQDTGHRLGVSVNVSASQLVVPHYARDLAAVLAHTGLAPGDLTVEVTESIWADEAAVRTLHAVRETGVRIALDDFGTGYSSLGYLQRFSFDVIKVDRSFTAAVTENERTRGIVMAILDLARLVGARTVAEGVESAAQAEWLRASGCDFAQGYLYSRPVTAEEVALPRAL